MFPSNPTTSSAEDECKPTVITATDEDEPDGVETILFENDEEEDNKSAIPVMEEDVKEADTALNAAALLADAGEEPSDPISITVAESTSSTAPQPLPITLVGDVKAPVLQATPVTIPATPVTISANTNQPVILIPVTNFPTPTLKQLVPIQIQQPVCITVAADAVPHLFRLASAPKQPSAFDALVHDPWIPEPPPGPRFPGRRQVSKLGLRPVMSYEIPGSNQSYVFSLERANVAYDLFECVQCKRNGKRTTIKGFGEEFIGDPCQLSHRCIPVNTKEFILQRLTYEKRQEIRKETAGLSRSQLKKKLKAVKEEIARELFCASEENPIPTSSSKKGQYVGQMRASEHGPVLVYPPAESNSQVYMFAKCKSHKNYDVYDCVLCREKGSHTFVKVRGVAFLTNPCKLPHKCDPIECWQLPASLTYEGAHETDSDSNSTEDIPKEKCATTRENSEQSESSNAQQKRTASPLLDGREHKRYKEESPNEEELSE